MNKRARMIVGLIGNLLLCMFGVYRLMTETSGSIFIPALFAVAGLVGCIGSLMELRKISLSGIEEKRK
ncbi:hypothetical protein [Bacillus badius]|uniref:hypothetical protein n=1 Tax=Bacillus badius TaxID=1455 RepID=UPI000596F626|nr:hypothetical protein [Bacillus badius]KIL72313.1 hypothetical protein SD78_4422 [Bacillus badius]